MARFLTWLLLVLLFGGFVGAAYRALADRAEAGKGMPDYSVYSRERNGLADLALLLRKLGMEAVAVTRPIHHTPNHGLLILVEPTGTTLLPGQATDLPDGDVRGILSWVEQGNTLLLCGRHMNGLHRELDVEIVADDRAGIREIARDAGVGETGGYTEGIAKLMVEGQDIVRVKNGLPLWWLEDEAGGVILRRGKGRVLVVADPSLLTGRGLRRADNILFPVNVVQMHARDGQVYFDEYHHGLRSGGGFWGYLRYHEQQWTLLQILLVAGVAGWAAAVRLGRAIPRPGDVHADAVEYASAVARIYQRAGVRGLLARTLARDFLEALTRHLRLRRTALPAEVLAAWRQRHEADRAGAGTERVRELLRGMVELRKGEMAERPLLAWSREFDRFLREETA